MNEAEARARLSDLVAATVFPTLSTEQVDRLLRQARRIDNDGHLPSETPEWQPNTDYALDDILVPTHHNGHTYKVTVAAKSGGVEPDWPTGSGESVSHAGVTYTEDGEEPWTPTYDFYRAAAEGWDIKAGMVSNRHAFGSNQGQYNPEQLFDHCTKMAKLYRDRSIMTVRLESGAWDGTGRINAAHYEDAV